jgi:DNA helicase MCM8
MCSHCSCKYIYCAVIIQSTNKKFSPFVQIFHQANPRQGKYNLNKTVAENLNIAPPLLSRFDLVFILRDDADIDHDKLVSGNIMNIYRQDGNIHDESHGSARKRQKTMETMPSNQFKIKQRLPWVAQTQNPLPADLLKDYITYAREYCKPKLTQEAAAVLKNYFLTLRYVQR